MFNITLWLNYGALGGCLYVGEHIGSVEPAGPTLKDTCHGAVLIDNDADLSVKGSKQLIVQFCLSTRAFGASNVRDLFGLDGF